MIQMGSPNLEFRLKELELHFGFLGPGPILTLRVGSKWDLPPNFLLVDYCNYLDCNVSVVKVATDMSNAPFHNNCCRHLKCYPTVGLFGC